MRRVNAAVQFDWRIQSKLVASATIRPDRNTALLNGSAGKP